MQKISTCLWFDKQAEEAAQFYTSVFKNSSITEVVRYHPDNQYGVADSVMTVSFVLDGEEFMALNGGPEFSFSEAISFVVHCESQAEVDYFWEKLSEGGEPGMCGWLKDRFGVSWQIVPDELNALLSGPDAEKVGRATQALLQMKKLDIAALRRAYEGG